MLGDGRGERQPECTTDAQGRTHGADRGREPALQDGTWDAEASYSPERAHRPDTIDLWRRISTVEDPEWTRRYHSTDPGEKAFGARAVITLRNGEVITDELAVADAHPLGAHPFARAQYEEKFTSLADGVVEPEEQQRFLAAVTGLAEIPAGGLSALNIVVPQLVLDKAPTIGGGIF